MDAMVEAATMRQPGFFNLAGRCEASSAAGNWRLSSTSKFSRTFGSSIVAKCAR